MEATTTPTSHQRRPVDDELRELYAIAVREHGPSARSSRLIAQALQRAGAPLPRGMRTAIPASTSQGQPGY